MPGVVLLGPQRFRPTVHATLQSLGVRGRVATVTAGWQEREEEDAELCEHMQCDAQNLRLYERFDDILQRNVELAAALRERQDRLHCLQELYRLRLDHALAAARELMLREGDGGEFLGEHSRAAIRAVKTLDRQHLVRIQQIHQSFEERWSPRRSPLVERHRIELARVLERCEALVVAGGHVAVLLNRLRLFDPLSLLDGRPVVAWSAGAMALSERVVLFHDSPPQGPGNAEVLDAGLARFRRLVPLPHGRRRLRLADPVRVALFAQRFGPASCVLLDEGTRLDWDGQGWSVVSSTRRLSRAGRLSGMSH